MEALYGEIAVSPVLLNPADDYSDVAEVPKSEGPPKPLGRPLVTQPQANRDECDVWPTFDVQIGTGSTRAQASPVWSAG